MFSSDNITSEIIVYTMRSCVQTDDINVDVRRIKTRRDSVTQHFRFGHWTEQ
jgi:hypothetical protein